MLMRITKAMQMTIPAEIRHKLNIDENTLLDVGLDKKERRIVIEPIKVKSLQELFKECDAIKNKTNKSIKELEEEYEREQMLNGF